MNPSPSANAPSLRALHVASIVLCVLTFGLIVWGAHVNTTRSGMAFPDWPTSNLSPMVTYAPSEWLWAKDKFWEHGHRLFAAIVGAVTTLVLVMAYRVTPVQLRPHRSIGVLTGVVLGTVVTALFGVHSMPEGFMELFISALALLLLAFLVQSARVGTGQRIVWLAMTAFVAVCLQGTFGGYTVRNNLPDWTSTIHGVLAEVFFLLILGIAFTTSSRWTRTSQQRSISRATFIVIGATWGITVVQFILGALTRHTDAWGVSTSFPAWSQESFFPSADLMQYPQVLIHLLHRSSAYVVAMLVVVQYLLIRKDGASTSIARLAGVSSMLVVVQIIVGGLIIWTQRGELVTTLHVALGVLLLAVNSLVMYSSFRRPIAAIASAAISHEIVGEGQPS